MRYLLNLTLFLCLGVNQITAQENPNWLRYSAISPDGQTIAFTYKGDIYTVSSAGGAAKALTSNEAYDFMPVWSHDGKSIAFASDRFGNFDVFVINADGGESKRLTFHSRAEYPYTFTADDKYIKNSIYNPDSQVVSGFNKGIMKSYKDLLKEGEIQIITDYLKTLNELK